jgi:hypothetical protein
MTGDVTTDAPFAAFILYNATALVVASWLHSVVERPGLRLRARMLAARARGTTPAASASPADALRYTGPPATADVVAAIVQGEIDVDGMGTAGIDGAPRPRG